MWDRGRRTISEAELLEFVSDLKKIKISKKNNSDRFQGLMMIIRCFHSEKELAKGTNRSGGMGERTDQ